MGSPLQTPDFFVLEASEALDDFEAALRADQPPSPDHLLRAVRLLRGAALMAGQQPIARTATVLETIARTYREHPSSWNAAVHDGMRQAAGEFRALVGRVREWSEADTARALQLGRALEGFADQSGATTSSVSISPDHVPAGDTSQRTLEAGIRAFVAREGALIASALDRAARMLRTTPDDREPLYTVIRRMQSLRGLAELGELMPLPEILDAIELAVGDLTRSFAPPPDAHEVVSAASHALTRLARDVAASGQPDAESVEVRRFTESLIRVFAVERDVIPIETLYVDGDPEPFQPPAMAEGFRGSAAFSPLELVSHGEHLSRAADLIVQARSALERDLRLYQLLGALRAVNPAMADPLSAALGVFTSAIRSTLVDGLTDEATTRVTDGLREVGTLLRRVAEREDRADIPRRIRELARAVRQGGAPMPEDDDDIVPIERLLLPEPGTDDGLLPIVPIESLAPDEAREPVEASPIERAFQTYARLRRERMDELPSLAAFLRQTPTASRASDAEPVAIAELCYRGPGALRRAALVRDALQAALASSPAPQAIRPLLDELLDLIPLAADS